MFVNNQLDLLILKTYFGQFTLTTKKSLHIIFNSNRLVIIIHLMFGRILQIFCGPKERPKFTRSAITPPKVNQFRWNLKHCEPNVGGWPWQILGAIHTVATVWEAAEILLFCEVNNARFCRFPVGQILRHFDTTTSIGEAVKTFGTEFWKFYHKGSFFHKKAKIALTNFQVFRPSYLRNDNKCRKLTAKWSPSRPNNMGRKMSVRPSVHKMFLRFQWNLDVGRGRWVMHDGMQYYPIQGQGQEPLKVGNSAIFKGHLLPHV